MKVGILGSGAVGIALGKGFLAEGHEVSIATHEPEGEKGKDLKGELPGATVAGFAEVAQAGELVILCVKAAGVDEVLKLVGSDSLKGKTVIDTTNVIAQESDMLVYGGKDASVAEHIQEALPTSNVIKAFNTVGAATMYKPDFDGQLPTMFIAGDEAEAKKQVSDIVSAFGWEALDCGKLIASRSLEPMALVWINNSIASGTPHHAFKML